MNSDQIQTQFGNYGIAVLSQSASLRLANLYSAHNGQRICRTLALTRFILPASAALADSDKRIRAGQSIGATLRADGFRVVRSDAIFTHTQSSTEFVALAQHTVALGTVLAVQVYQLTAVRAGERLPYAVIAEAYHPEHISADPTLPALAEVLTHIHDDRSVALAELCAAL